MKTLILNFSKFFLIFALLQNVECNQKAENLVETDKVSIKAELLNIWQSQEKLHKMDLEEGFRLNAEIEKEFQMLSELQHATKKCIREQSALELSEILSGNRSIYQQEKFLTNYENFKKHLGPITLDAVLSSAIDAISTEKSLEVIFADLCFIWLSTADCKINSDSKNLEPLIKSQLMLHKAYGKQIYPNLDYLKKLALLLHKIRKTSSYENLQPNLKYAMSNIIESLPDNLKYLFFKPYFCMMNEEHKEFIYTAIDMKVNQFTRYIWLWHDKYSIDNTGHIQAEVVDNDFCKASSDLKITLRGTRFNLYYYLMPGVNGMVGGLAPSKSPFNHIWGVQLLDNDKIVWRQNDTIVCSNARHDSERRLVNAFKLDKEFNEKRLSCQWSIGSCKRN